MWLACLVLAVQPAVAAPAAAFDAAAALTLMQHSTAFGRRSGRTGLQIRRVVAMDEPSGGPRGYFVEASWTVDLAYGGKTPEGGVAVVQRVDEIDADARVLGTAGGWALTEMMVGKTWDEIVEELAKARASAEEASVVGQLRGLGMAQMAFAASAGGAFAGELRCLARPAECIDGYTGPPFAEMPEAERWGYRFTLVAEASPNLKKGLAKAFALTAVPAAAEPRRRSFCIDAVRVCAVKPGETLPRRPECPDSCAPLE